MERERGDKKQRRKREKRKRNNERGERYCQVKRALKNYFFNTI